MNFDIKLWNHFDADSRKMISIAALIVPPISLDLWAKLSNSSSVKVLQLSEKLQSLNLMHIYSPKGSGYYFFSDQELLKDIIVYAGQKNMCKYVHQSVPILKAEYPEGPQRWMAIAYIYQITNVIKPDFSILSKAAEYCRQLNRNNDAATYYQIVIDSLVEKSATNEEENFFVNAVIGLHLSKGRQITLPDQEKLLMKALHLARKIGKAEPLIMVLILSGQVYLKQGKYDLAGEQFDKGRNQAKIHGNEELLKRVTLASTEFLFCQGRLSEAIERYEDVLGNLEELPSDELTLQACAMLGWIYGKCGQMVRGFGLINAVIEKANELTLEKLQIYAKMMALLTLHDARRNEEAEPIIEELLSIPEKDLDHYLSWIICAAKTYVLSYNKEYEEAFHMQKKTYHHGRSWGITHHRGPIIFESTTILEDAGFVHPEMNFDVEINRVIDWPDTYMQGVGYYYRAKRALNNGGKTEDIHQDLLMSIDLLTQSGAKLDLTFSQILLARLLLKQNQIEASQKLLKKAWSTLLYVNENLFPEDLKHYVVPKNHDEVLLEPLIEISNTIGTIRNRHELLNQIISLTMRLTGAERGAFFGLKNKQEIEIIASRNFIIGSRRLEPDVIKQASFSKTRDHLVKAMETGKEEIISNIPSEPQDEQDMSNSGWQIVYPVLLEGKVSGCFYLERKLSGFAVSEKTLSILKVIATQVSVALDNVRAYEEIAGLKDRLEAETLFYRSEPSNMRQITDIIGDSKGIQEVITKIEDVAQSDASVLIVGETGVGKELVAKAVHQLSQQSTGPFIPVSISSLSQGLISSELFGHEKGAFTNAIRAHRGRFELADNGTLFLDEVNSLSLDIQAKLLRVLEEKKFERVGGNTLIRSKFRLIAASNQPLDQLVAKGEFRSDLFYRLNVYPIHVPPLRDRKEDIPQLVSHFVNVFNKRFNKNFMKTAKNTMQQLLAYHWPGNVRELKHTVERAILTCKGKQLSFFDFISNQPHQKEKSRFLSLQDMERQYIVKALKACEGKVSGDHGAAQLLDIKSQTLYSKIKRLGIKKKFDLKIDPQ